MNKEYEFLLLEIETTIRDIEKIDIRYRNSKQNETLVRSRIELKNLEKNWVPPAHDVKELEL